MANRITQNMLNSQFMINLQRNYQRMDDLNMKMTTGRRINRPSDDPIGLSFAMRYRSQSSEIEQYQRNVDNAKSWLDYTDTILDQTNQVLSRINELTIQASTGTNSLDAMKASAQEVEQLKNQLTNIGNTVFRGKYIFNGQLTNMKPFDETNPEKSTTHKAEISYEVNQGVFVPISINGNDVFGPANLNGVDSTNPNLFAVVDRVVQCLKNNDTKGSANMLKLIETTHNRLQDIRSSVGAKINRVDLTDQRLKDASSNVVSLLAKTEDADMGEVITQMKMDENVYQASLSAGSKLIKPTLMDFLR